MLAISHAPLEKLEAFKKRMGWNFKWVSAFNTDFNYDYHVSVRPEEPKANKVYYNYREIPPFGPECHGISVFYKDENRDVFHTYSTHARGLDMLNTAYHTIISIWFPRGATRTVLRDGCAIMTSTTTDRTLH